MCIRQIKHIAEYASINVQISEFESNDKSNPRYLAESVTSTKYCTLKNNMLTLFLRLTNKHVGV